MKTIKNSVCHFKKIDCQRRTGISTAVAGIVLDKKLLCLALMMLCAANQDVWAVGEDALGRGVTTAETMLTGSMLRLIVIAGSVFGVIKAYMASSPLLMGGSIAIGIGVNLLLDWVKATWAILI